MIQLKTPQLELKICREIQIDSSYVPLDIFLYSNSLSNNEVWDIEAIDINIKIQVKFNRWKSLFSRKMDDYQWVDKLHIDLEKYIDIHNFELEMEDKKYEYLFDKISTMEEKINTNLYSIKIKDKQTRRVLF